MKCPLMFNGAMGVVASGKGTDIDCLKEECAWWDSFAVRCAISVIARELKSSAAALRDIASKIPYGQKGA